MWGKKKQLSNKSPVDGFRPIIVDGKPSCPCLVKMWGIISVIVFFLFTFNSKPSFLFYYVNLPKGEVLVNLCVSTFTNWGRVTHICFGNLTIIGSDNCLSPGQRQTNIWTDAGILLIGPSGTDFNEILIKIHTFSFKKIYLKMSPGRWH